MCGAPLAAADVTAPPLATEATPNNLSGPICPVCRRGNRAASVFCAFCGYRLKQPTGPQAYALPYAGAAAAAPSTQYAQPPAIPSDASGNLPTGTLLKRHYRILRKIAQGGMGAVYESTDIAGTSGTPGRRWAVKEMSPAALPASERTQAIADFRREAQMLAALHHPNLPEVVETFEQIGKYFLVMEFIPGRTLLNVLENWPGFLAEEGVMVWARQLFDVLQYLHSQNPPIIYRDLKPANVMLVESTERIKLIDFGIARFHKAGKSRDTEAFGTAGYAPPEQYGKGQTDQRSDVYALAATIHYLVTKHDPSLSPFNWLPVRRYNPALSPRLESALQTALSLDPAKRYPTIEDFATGMGIQLAPVPQRQRSWEAEPVPTLPALPTPTVTQAPARSNGSSASRSQSKKKQAATPRIEASAIPTATQVTHLEAQVTVDRDKPPYTGIVEPPGISSPVAPLATPPQARPRPEKKSQQEPAAALVVSDRVLDLGDVRWNSKSVRKVSLAGVGGGFVKGTIAASQPWIAYNPQRFQGNAVTVEVKIKKRQLRLGRVELQVPNLFAIIWARARRALPLLVVWFWLLFLAGSSLGKTLLWAFAAVMGALLAFEALMWLWAAHVRLLVPAEKMNTGRLLVKSSGGEQQIEVRAMARPSWARRALGWTVALLLLTVEVGAIAWTALTLLGIEIPLPGL